MTTSRFQDIIDSLESLSVEDQDYLFDLIRKRPEMLNLVTKLYIFSYSNPLNAQFTKKNSYA